MEIGRQGQKMGRLLIRRPPLRKCRRFLPSILLALAGLAAASCLLRPILWVDAPQSAPPGIANARTVGFIEELKGSPKSPSEMHAGADATAIVALARSLQARDKRAAAVGRAVGRVGSYFAPRRQGDDKALSPTGNGSAASVDVEWLARKFPFPLDSPNTVDQRADGHRVRFLCGAGKVKHIVFVHTDPTHLFERKLLRATVGHPRVAALFKWSLFFLVGQRPGVNVTDEAARLGDVVQLPFFDHYRNLSLKFIYGLRWIMLNCPRVRSVVKVDDDVFVHPEALDAYLRSRLKPGDRRLHCSTFRGNAVIRNPHSRHYLSVREYPGKYFPTHCHGWFVIIPAPVMWDLYVASFRVPAHAIDDAYVTGDLAKAAALQHVDISAALTADEDKLLELLRGEYMCALFTGRSKLSIRVSLWKTLSHVKKRQDLDEAMQHTLKNFNYTVKKMPALA